jgi:hypothetical protein
VTVGSKACVLLLLRPKLPTHKLRCIPHQRFPGVVAILAAAVVAVVMQAAEVEAIPVVAVEGIIRSHSRKIDPLNRKIPMQILPLTKILSFSWARRIVSPTSVLALIVLTLPVSALAANEQTFASPQDALAALVTAATNHDENALHLIFGHEGHALVSPDLVQANDESNLFIKRLTQKVQLFNNSDTNITLEIGTDSWPFPIPLVKQDGKWFFDSTAGKQEILARRIGRDEIGAINVSNAYVDAQREYASQDRLGDGVLAYAQFLHSNADKHDGLYWHSQAGEELSPLGPLIAQAHVEGYHNTAKMLNDEQAPYHGYYFKILTSQGKHAPGGAYDYIINGHMIAGFALIAWPAQWGDTGVMTFIVNQQGKVYQKNLGSSTFDIAQDMTAYAPNGTWIPVQADPVMIAQRHSDDSSMKAGTSSQDSSASH